MAYQYKNSRGQEYYLHSKEVDLRSGKKQRIYYFSKTIGTNSLDEVPSGYKVVESQRTGLPVLKKG